MINFKKAIESATPPTMDDLTAEREKLNKALKRYKIKATVFLGIALLACMAVIVYLNENLSGSMDMVLFNAGIAFIFIVAMTIHTIGERQENINALEPYQNLEELTDIKNKSAQAAAYLTQIKDRDAVSGEVSFIKELILQEETRNAAEAKKLKNQELRRKYRTSVPDQGEQVK